jgi:hypothetical protein
MNREPISEVTIVKLTTRELSNNYIRANFTGRSVSSCIAKKVCISCHKGFNKKKGRMREELSSVMLEGGIPCYECTKCFSK